MYHALCGEKVQKSHCKTKRETKLNSASFRSKYHLDSSDLRLPPPVLCMSDFERHAQRKNRVIQANYDDELVKIGIDCKVSSKFLTSDARRFYHRVSSSQKSLSGASAKQKNPTSDPKEAGLKCGERETKLPAVKRKGVSKSRCSSKEAWAVPPVKSNLTRTKDVNPLSVSKIQPDASSERNIFLTDAGLLRSASSTRRLIPHSAKVPRSIPDGGEDTPRRPKTTTVVTRHVTFWDMVDKDAENSRSKKDTEETFKKSKKISRTGTVSSEPTTCGIKLLAVIPTETGKRRVTSNTKEFAKPSETVPSTKPLTSFLHFDKLQAGHELRRELRNNAEKRKIERRRRKLSELLNLERTSYMESLSKMASRLRDEKLLEFCRESCRGLQNVFNYNL